MQAIVQDRYGSPGVLQTRDIAKPQIADNEVLVHVHAASVHLGDLILMTGTPYLMRMATGLSKPKIRVPGTDVAGTVEAVGKDVERLRPGDQVFGWCTGAFAEYARAGGVGTFAVQIAKAFGAEVTGVCSTNNVELVRSIGADHVIDYTREDFTRSATRYDFILDNVGNHSMAKTRRALSPTGMLLSNGGGHQGGKLGRVIKAAIVSMFVRQQGRPSVKTQNPADLQALKVLVEAGKVMPVIDGTYPLRATPEAIGHVGQGHARGTVVIALIGAAA